jgi:hypothetical protein
MGCYRVSTPTKTTLKCKPVLPSMSSEKRLALRSRQRGPAGRTLSVRFHSESALTHRPRARLRNRRHGTLAVFERRRLSPARPVYSAVGTDTMQWPIATAFSKRGQVVRYRSAMSNDSEPKKNLGDRLISQGDFLWGVARDHTALEEQFFDITQAQLTTAAGKR